MLSLFKIKCDITNSCTCSLEWFYLLNINGNMHAKKEQVSDNFKGEKFSTNAYLQRTKQ
jgi:hypothetical protein